MQLELTGSETLGAPPQQVWDALNDPKVLQACIPGCRRMTETAPDSYVMEVHLKVAAVGGSFEGAVALEDKKEPVSGNIRVSGEGSIGTGTGAATFTLEPDGQGGTVLHYDGRGEIGGLVAGVGQRILKSVAKHLVKQFFGALKKQLAPAPAAAR